MRALASFFSSLCGILLVAAFAHAADNRYTGGVPISIDQNVSFNFNITGKGNRTATVWYNNEIAIAIEGASSSTFDRSTMEKIVALMALTKRSFEDFTGVRNLPLNGNYRNLPTIQIPLDNNGAGGLAAHGVFGLSVGRGMFDDFHDRIGRGDISIDQVWLYEMNRNFYISGWNAYIDWAMDGNSSAWGYWTVGFNNAAAIWIVDDLGVEMHYFGQYRDQFRLGFAGDLDTYLANSSYSFDNVWTKSIFPWRHQSINNLMSAVLLEWYEDLGGKPFIQRLYQEIDNTPKLANRFDYVRARDNWYKIVSRASNSNQVSWFENTLRWPISSAAENQIAGEIGSGGGSGGGGGSNPNGIVLEAEEAVLTGAWDIGSSSSASGGLYIYTAKQGRYFDENHTLDRAEFTFELPESGIYRIKGSVYADEGTADSLWLSVNGGTRNLWDTTVGDLYGEIDVNNRNVSEFVEVDLSAGLHRITVYPREDGTHLDRLRLVRVGDSAGGGENGGNPGLPSNPEVPVPGNIVSNAGFESALSPWFGQYESSVARTSVDNLTGSYSLRSHARPYNYSGPAITLTSQLQPGKKYSVTGSMKLVGSAAGQTAKATIGITDNNGFRFAYVNDAIPLSAGEWVEVSGEVDLTTSTYIDSAYLLFYGPEANQEFLLDQISVVESNLPPDPEPNLISNGDFESNSTNGWQVAYGGNISTTATARSGRRAITSTGRVNWYDGFLQVITDKVQPGVTYSINGWARMVSGTDSIDIRVLYQDDSGHHWIRVANESTSTSWNNVGGSFVVNPTGTLTEVRLFFFGPSAGNAFIVDDIELKEDSEVLPPL